MQKPQVGVEHVAVEQREVVQLARSSVDARRRSIAGGIVMRDPLGERQARGIGCRIRGRLLRDQGNHRRAEAEGGNRKRLLHHALPHSVAKMVVSRFIPAPYLNSNGDRSRRYRRQIRQWCAPSVSRNVCSIFARSSALCRVFAPFIAVSSLPQAIHRRSICWFYLSCCGPATPLSIHPARMSKAADLGLNRPGRRLRPRCRAHRCRARRRSG